jgi:hypothetical protein
MHLMSTRSLVPLHLWSRLNADDAHPAGPHQIDTLILEVVTIHDGEWHIQARTDWKTR